MRWEWVMGDVAERPWISSNIMGQFRTRWHSKCCRGMLVLDYHIKPNDPIIVPSSQYTVRHRVSPEDPFVGLRFRYTVVLINGPVSVTVIMYGELPETREEVVQCGGTRRARRGSKTRS